MRTINDPVEKVVAYALTKRDIEFSHEKDGKIKGQNLDFYLPKYDIFIECKAFSTPRTSKQIEDKKVIVIQSIEAAKAFADML